MWGLWYFTHGDSIPVLYHLLRVFTRSAQMEEDDSMSNDAHVQTRMTNLGTNYNITNKWCSSVSTGERWVSVRQCALSLLLRCSVYISVRLAGGVALITMKFEIYQFFWTLFTCYIIAIGKMSIPSKYAEFSVTVTLFLSDINHQDNLERLPRKVKWLKILVPQI